MRRERYVPPAPARYPYFSLGQYQRARFEARHADWARAGRRARGQLQFWALAAAVALFVLHDNGQL